MMIYPVVTNAVSGGDAALTITYDIHAVADDSIITTRTVSTDDPIGYVELIQGDMAATLMQYSGHRTVADALLALAATYTKEDWKRFGI
jgi:hypothetical protein